MFRKYLIDLLLDNPMSVTQIARTVDESPGQVTSDLQHLLLSLRHTEYTAIIDPAACHKCGFVFSQEKLKKPSKCPKCHSTWLTEPRISIQPKS